jgi:hypothetical protein
MKKLVGTLIFITVGVWAIIVFVGLILGLKSTLKSPPKDDSQSATKMLQEQRQKTADTAERQKLLMEQRRQQIRDMQKR